MKIYKGKVIGVDQFTSKKGEVWAIIYVTYGNASNGGIKVARAWTHNLVFKVGDVCKIGDDGYKQFLVEEE